LHSGDGFNRDENVPKSISAGASPGTPLGSINYSTPRLLVTPPQEHHPHPPSPFVIIALAKSWYSFYGPTEGGRLSDEDNEHLWKSS